jgi:putative iron-dependent peroxidase
MTKTACQPALAAEGVPAAMSIEWDLRGDARALWSLLPALAADDVVIGLGQSLLLAVGAEVPGSAVFERLQHGRHTMPATPHALWTLVPGASSSAVFETADRLKRLLAPHLRVAEATTLFAYRQGRDLTGYVDGSANPHGDEAWAAALVPEGPFAGGSFALVQRWLHFRERFAALPQAARDDTIGRTLADDEEMDDAPRSAHIKRTEQEDYDPPAFMLRRSMPWGDARRNGLQFIAFMSDLAKAQRMLRRMMGLEDGLPDALLGHSQAETGAFYFVPPLAQGRLVLPVVAAAVAPPPGPVASPAAARPVIRLRDNGPLVLEGDFLVAGQLPAAPVLCRCGRSASKPYCDGSHRQSGFVGAGSREPMSAPAADQPSGTVRIQPIADGPLVVHGCVDIAARDGQLISRETGPTLCRCGASANQPFCDGWHAAVGFCAPE